MSIAADIAQSIQDLRDEAVVVSRAASPALRQALHGAQMTFEAPVVRGRTVWSAAPSGVACVETPNWWGRTEFVPPDRRIVVIDWRHRTVSHEPGMAADPPGWHAQIGLMRRCLHAATQLRGVAPAHGEPEAPWAVLLLPVAAEGAARIGAHEGVEGMQALDPRVPELPGGVRLALPAGAGSEWVAAVVASITQAVERSGAA